MRLFWSFNEPHADCVRMLFILMAVQLYIMYIMQGGKEPGEAHRQLPFLTSVVIVKQAIALAAVRSYRDANRIDPCRP